MDTRLNGKVGQARLNDAVGQGMSDSGSDDMGSKFIECMYYVYVLNSTKFTYHYVGMTENIEKRLIEHNEGRTKSNKAYRPFEIIYSEEVETREKARERENI